MPAGQASLTVREGQISPRSGEVVSQADLVRPLTVQIFLPSLPRRAFSTGIPEANS